MSCDKSTRIDVTGNEETYIVYFKNFLNYRYN